MAVLLVALFVRTAIVGLPFISYRLRQRSIQSDCTRVRPGMSLTEVQLLIHASAPPTQEWMVGDKFSFGRWETCEVKLNLATSTVESAHMIESQLGQP